MTPGEQLTWTGPAADAVLRDAAVRIWHLYVLQRFTTRCGWGDCQVPRRPKGSPVMSSASGWNSRFYVSVPGEGAGSE